MTDKPNERENSPHAYCEEIAALRAQLAAAQEERERHLTNLGAALREKDEELARARQIIAALATQTPYQYDRLEAERWLAAHPEPGQQCQTCTLPADQCECPTEDPEGMGLPLRKLSGSAQERPAEEPTAEQKHEPVRKSSRDFKWWECGTCGKPWPCPDAEVKP